MRPIPPPAHPPRPVRPACLGLAAGIALCATPALAQQSVSIDLTNVQLRHNTNQSRSSAPNTLAPAARYRYEISGNVRGLPLLSALWLLFANPVPLADAMESLVPGSSEALSGVVANPDGTHPFAVSNIALDGSSEIGGTTVTFAATIAAGLNADNTASFSITNVTISPSSIGYLQFTSGSVVITRLPCPANFDEGGAHGAVNSSDISAFITAWLGDLNNGTRNADHNLDGVVNSSDISAFITDWLAAVGAGCPE